MEPQQYRPLGPEEIIQDGDEWQAICNPLWGTVGAYVIGKRPQDLLRFEFRRPIPVAKSERADESMTLDQLKSRIETKLDDIVRHSEALQLMADTAALERDALRDELVETYKTLRHTERLLADSLRKPVKESLTTDPDESSDNSLSFKEIKILGEEVEMWKKICRENDADLVAMKLRLEKAEAGRLECERQYQEQVAKVAVWMDKAEQAERERDEAHVVLGMRTQERDTLRAELAEAETSYKNLSNHVEKSLPYAGCHSIPEHIDNAADEIRNLRANETRLREAIRDMLIKAHEKCDEATEMELERIASLAGKGAQS